jgi:hypothetical protein
MADRAGRPRALTVHGPAGRLDVVCPASATVGELARAYADLAGGATRPLLHTRSGELLPVTATLAGAGIETGAVLVATAGIVRHAPRRPTGDAALGSGGGGRHRGRRRRDVVSTRDGTGRGSPVDGSRPGR